MNPLCFPRRWPLATFGLLGILAAAATAPSTRASDVWSILEDTPGVLLDRVNVAGTEGALQPVVVWRGDPGSGASWTLDGIDVTDPAAPGASGLYLHPNLLNDVRLVGRTDIRVRTGGLPVTLRTQAAGPRGLLFARLAPAALQSDNLSPALRDSSVQATRLRHLGEAGARIDRTLGAFALGAGAAWTELRQHAFTEHDETHRLAAANARAAGMLGATRVTLSLVRAEKVHGDRDTTLTTEPAARWRQSGPVYVAAFGAARPLSESLQLSMKAGYLDSTFRLSPAGGTAADPFEDFRGVFRGSYLSLHSSRRRLQVGAEMQARPSLDGDRLELVAGFGYRYMPVSTRSGWPGNKIQAFEREQVFFRTFRLTGFAIPTRDQDVRSAHDHWEGYAQARWTRLRYEVTAGVRVDRLAGRNRPVTIAANPLFPELLPALSFSGSPARFTWIDVLPRAAAEWIVTLSTRVRAQYAAYAGPLGSGDATFDHPGRDIASISYYWRDRNEDRIVQADEVEIARGRLGSSGIDPERPGVATALHQIDPGLRAPRTHEWSLTGEQAAGRTVAALTTYYRRQARPLWRPLRGLARSDYSIRGAVRGRLFEDDYSVGYYAPASASKIAPGNGRVLTNREGYHQDVIGIELSLSGSAGPLRWDTWAALTDWRERFDDETLSIQDPTPTDGEPNRNGGAVAVRAGGFGRDVFVNARLSGGATGHVTLPAAFTASVFVRAREGFPTPYVHIANAGDPTAGAKAVLVSPSLAAYRLPVLAEIDLGLERGWKVRKGRLITSADAFNVLNSATPLQVNRDVESPSFAQPREILRPRIVRLGVRYEF